VIPDVIVIGTGLAGLSAAVRLGDAGARVLVLAKGVGGTHLGAGTIDVLGYTGSSSGADDGGRLDRVQRPVAALADLPPGHPYGQVGAEGVATAVDWFKERIASGPLAPYAYEGGPDDNLLLPTAVGAVRPSAVVPETMAAGDVRRGGRVCVVGFRALKDFHAPLLADNLSRAPEGVEARGVELDLAPGGEPDVSSLGFARGFDEAAFRAEVAAQVSGRLRVDERVAFPAALGVADPHGAWSELERQLGRPVFEIPTLPPSVPGIRLYNSLRHALRRAGGEIILGAVVTGADRDGDRVTALRTRVGLRETLHRAPWIVLATGGFASGGVALDSRWNARETALGLPLARLPEPGGERFRPNYFDEHPLSRAGVAVDGDLRPVGANGDRLLDNVLVAGATLAGAVPWKEKSGDGLSLATGFRAAELIIQGSDLGPRAAQATAEA
jgi:glycerol-3-phosphate dehydrogenase subunit B